MGIEDDVLKIGKKLEKLVSSGTQDHTQAMDLLGALRDTKMTLDVLQKTRIGMIVNNLRKASTNDDVVTLSKTLIKNWKKLLSNDTPGIPRTTSRSSGDASSQKMDETSNDGTTDDAKDRSENKEENSSASSKTSNTTDAVRLKCRELLTNALRGTGK
ncbi:transcription elongation factor a protein 1 [Plakobranchus ocellatus]|uniref:Transcription elongation factor a protein 1 n=1 Tax=Plakobranchus ocellatus TaxID=259542 RepID=A0AAV3ZKC2_9GAST|nr:transcription elongation factor a protein 1 [Plakobranchus ocellatus]